MRTKVVMLFAVVFAAVVMTAKADPPAHPGNSENAPGHTSAHGNSDHSQGNAGTSGTWNQPQPTSNADQNSGGANGQCPGGPYCSTRDGSPSGNGNGNGQAVGKPCAGCVGRADNKNPHGQMPNGSDHNAGYECDTNSGIGQTNPAHTGCTSSPPPPCSGPKCVPSPPPSCGQPNVCTPPVRGRGHTPTPHVRHRFRHSPPVAGPTPSPTPSVTKAQPSGQLPLTGQNTLPLGMIGLGLTGAGIALARLRRSTA